MSTFFYTEMNEIREKHLRRPAFPLENVGEFTLDNVVHLLINHCESTKATITTAINAKLYAMGLQENDLQREEIKTRQGIAALLAAKEVVAEIEKEARERSLRHLYSSQRHTILEKCMKDLPGSRSSKMETFTQFCLVVTAVSLLAVIATSAFLPVVWTALVSAFFYIGLTLSKSSSGTARALESLLLHVTSHAEKITAHVEFEALVTVPPTAAVPAVTVSRPIEVQASSPTLLKNNEDTTLDITSRTNDSPVTLCLFDAPARKGRSASHDHGHPSSYPSFSTAP